MTEVSTLYSGSSGNSTYIGTPRCGLLIDAGLNAKALTGALRELGVSEDAVQAIFVTHIHSDHVTALRVFGDRHPGLPIYGTAETLQQLVQLRLISAEATLCEITPQGTEAAGLWARCFATPHDAAGSCGYTVEDEKGDRVGVCTDLGCVTEEVERALTGCVGAVLESNHDENILKAGNYPFYLKRRILGSAGHLSNNCCASLAAMLLQNGCRRFALAHLSKENNLPELAYDTTLRKLCDCGAEQGDFSLKVAHRSLPVRHFTL